MTPLSQKIATAKAHGYSDSEIASYLAQDPGMAPKIALARKSGYSDGDIISHLDQGPARSADPTAAQAAAVVRAPSPSSPAPAAKPVAPQGRHTFLGDMGKALSDSTAAVNRAGGAGNMAAAVAGGVTLLGGTQNALAGAIGRGVTNLGGHPYDATHITPDGKRWFSESDPATIHPLLRQADGKIDLSQFKVRADAAHSDVANADLANAGINLATFGTGGGGAKKAVEVGTAAREAIVGAETAQKPVNAMANLGRPAVKSASTPSAAHPTLTSDGPLPSAPPKAVRRYDGVDHPVEILSDPVKDQATGKTLIKVRGENGATGYVPHDEVFAAGAPQAAAPEVSPAQESSAPATVKPQVPAKAAKMAPDRLKAAKKVEQLAKDAKVNPDQAFADNGLLPVQNIGQSAEGVLKAAARRPGETNKRVRDLVDLYNASAPTRLSDIVERSAGVDRLNIEGQVQDIIGEAQKRAKPRVDAYENMGPTTSPDIEELLGTPTGREYLRGALKNARDARAPQHDIEVLAQLVDGMPTDGGPVGSGADYLDQATEFLQSNHVRAALKKQLGPSLTEYLAKTGGLSDTGGDVAAMDGHIMHRGVPFKNKLVKPGGRGLDDAAVAAWEAGYFPDHSVPPDLDHFMETVRQDIGGKKTYAQPEGEAGALASRVENFETKLAHYEIDPTGKTAKQIADELAREEATVRSYQYLADHGTASVEPETALVEKAVVTPRVLWDTKKFGDADKLVRDAKAEKTGASAPDDFAKNKWLGDFREALRSAFMQKGFDWDALMRETGEAPKIQKAYTDGKTMIEGHDYETLRDHTRDMSDVEKKAALGGFVKSILDTVKAKQRIDPSRLRLYGTDDFAARIGHMSGSFERGQQFQSFMRHLAKQGEVRGLVGGSHTADIGMGNAELDDMSSGPIDVKKIPKSREALVGVALDQVNKVLDRVHAGASVGQRNELGRMLLERDYGRKALEDLAAHRKATSIGARVAAVGKAVSKSGAAAKPVSSVNAMADAFKPKPKK